MRLARPYQIAYASYDRTVNVFLALETDLGFTGFGCAAPDEQVTGESSEAVQGALEQGASSLIGQEALRRSRLLERLREPLAGTPSARAAIDMSLFDLLGKRCGLPLYQLLGGYRRSIRTSATVGILPLEETIEEARRLLSEGFTCLKIKGGKSLEMDVERVMRTREIAGPRVSLRFDANQGYTVPQALSFCEAVRAANVEMLEQPTRRGEHGLLGEVTSRAHLRVMADESLIDLRDAFRLARRSLVDMVNVKLMKVGGLSEALHIDSIARAAGLDVMVGCMDESALSIAAGLHFALGRPGVRYADLDGNLGLIGDPAVGAVTLRKGVLRPTGRPGLGFDLNEHRR
jgi:L-alanine-DL-glutamate epimerase-like enolase superfamily enzyme